MLQDTVEYRLRRFGITISDAVFAHLSVELTLQELDRSGESQPGWMWALTMGFHEPVVPRRRVEAFADRATELALGEESARQAVRSLALTGTYGTTWSASNAGVERSERIGAAVRESVDRLLTEFLAHYLGQAGTVWSVEVRNVAPYPIAAVVGDVTMTVGGGATLRFPVASDERPEVRIRCTAAEPCPEWLRWIRQIEVSITRLNLP